MLHFFINVLNWYMVNTKHTKNTISHTKTMPSASAKTAETAAYEAVRAVPFTRIRGRPTRHDYETLKKEASDLASEVDNLTFDWCCNPATGEEYGLLAKIIGDVEYTHFTTLE